MSLAVYNLDPRTVHSPCMAYALEHRTSTCIRTEMCASRATPAAALREYRQRSGIADAKLIVCGMTSGGFTLADPEDAGMLDVVGFDTATPAIMADFVMGLL